MGKSNGASGSTEEFWARQTFTEFDTAAATLHGWERTYNYDRLSLALRGRTPAEKLALFPLTSQVA